MKPFPKEAIIHFEVNPTNSAKSVRHGTSLFLIENQNDPLEMLISSKRNRRESKNYGIFMLVNEFYMDYRVDFG
jgi:hypothetical protein